MTVVRSVSVLAVAAAVAGAAMASVYTAQDGLLTAALLAACGAPVLAVAHALAARRDRIGSLARQFRLGVALAVGLALAGVGCVAVLMFVSPHDAFTAALLLGFAGVVAAYSAGLVARQVLEDVEAVRDGLGRVGRGERDVRISTRANDELAQLAEAANRMTRQLAEGETARDAAEAARRELVAAVSHDLRTPLTSLRLLADAVEDEVVDPAERQLYLAQMSIHIHSLSTLIEDLFELSRIEAGNLEWSMQRVQIGDLVEETVEAMQPQAHARRVAIEASIPDTLAPAEGNPEKLQRVLFNLVQNAIRHTPADGSVTVAATANGSSLEIEVADTGAGISAADGERVFEPFFRGGSEAARPRDGAGLGLTICRAIVEAHGGRIWLDDCSEGTRIKFSLPRG